ncbi:hypothetical protein RJ639_014485 [Escallonia herrerae]|uniref:Uncharacterized protein n=1 Tax=Escallonia herrerae TaxID=1293975 RepID=A0AA88VHG1_9ASTE|nr:hypothetical protein RJ639_014485 [Escallonia herrerae]
MKFFRSGASLLVLFILLVTHCLEVDAQSCQPNGGITGTKSPAGQCNEENDSDCCVQGKFYTTYKCSPPVSADTSATLTVNSFQKGGDGGSLQNVITNTILTTPQLWLDQLVGTAEGVGATTISL